MANSTLSVDPRIISPFVCCPDDGLARFPSDTLNRVSYSLSLFAELIGNHDGSTEWLQSENLRFALTLHLEGMAGTLQALAEALPERETALGPDEIPIRLSDEERAKLEKIASRRGCSVAEAARRVLSEELGDFRPDKPRAN